MRHLFIVNPQAGKGKTVSYIPKIEELCKSKGIDYIIEITKGPGDATTIARKYVQTDNFVVHSVGGDGTLNEVLNGIVGSNSKLSIIPSGSGNDFIKNIYTQGSWETILERSINCQSVSMDLGRVNDRYFINISSAGLDAAITYNARKLKKCPFIPSKFAYLMSIFFTVFGYKSRNLKISMDDKELKVDTLLIAVANGKFYGGGMKVAPYAEVDDGIFDICHVEKVSTFKIIRLFPKLIRGVHESIKEVHFYKSKVVKIASDEVISFNIDGELLMAKEVFFEIIPKAINIVV